MNTLCAASMAAGYIVGPLLSAAMYAATKHDGVDKDIHGVVVGYANPWWNRATAPAWMIIFLLAPVQVAFLFWPEPTIETNERRHQGIRRALHGIHSMRAGEKVSFCANLVASFCIAFLLAAYEIVSVNEAVFTWRWQIDTAAVYVGLVNLLVLPPLLLFGRYVKLSDRAGQLASGCVACAGFFFLWDFYPGAGGDGPVALYTVGSWVVLSGIQLARGVCWSMLSKQVPTHAKGFGNMIMYNIFILGRGTGALIADLFRTDAQSGTNYADFGFPGWSPQNTYAWSNQLVALLAVVLWAVLYRYMIPCRGSS